MIKQLYSIVRKNFIMLLRSKLATIVVLAGPILLIVLLGLGIKGEYSHVIVGTLKGNTSMYGLDELMKNLESDAGFEYTYFDTEEDCRLSVKQGKSHLCIIFRGIGNETTVYVDISKANLAYAVLNLLSNSFEAKSEQISIGLVREILEKIAAAQNSIKEKTANIGSVKSNVNAMPLRLEEIKEGLGKFTIDTSILNFNFDSYFDDAYGYLDKYGGEVDDEYIVNKEKLDEIKENVSLNKEELIKEKRKRDSYLETIDELYVNNSCNEKQHIDLTPYLQRESYPDMEYYDPVCSAIVTTRSELLIQTRDIDNSIAMLELIEDNLNDAGANLDNYKARLDGVFTDVDSKFDSAYYNYKETLSVIKDLEGQLDNITAMRDDMMLELESVNSVLLESSGLIGGIEEAIAELNNNFDAVSGFDAGQIIDPFQTKVELTNASANQLDYFFASLLVMIMTFTCVMLSGLIMVREKTSRAFFRNSIIPLKDINLAVGIVISVSLIGSLQAGIIMLLAKAFFGVTDLTNPLGLALAVMLSTAIFSLVGLLVGSIMHSEESTVLAAVIVSVILFVFSGVLMPVEIMTQAVYVFSKTNPFYICETFIKRITTYEISMFSRDIIITYLTEAVVLFGLSVAFFKRAKKKL
jgi:ABC-type multidrug transport system permease subunit